MSNRFGRIPFLISLIVVAALSAGAMLLLKAHAESHHALLAVGYSLVILGVFWIRCLGSRLMDAGLPRWTFWPFFLIIFTACMGLHLTKRINGPETMGLFLLLQLPAMLFQSQSAPAEFLPGSGGEVAAAPRKPRRPVAPMGAVDFAIYFLLLAGLWHVLHLLRVDVGGFGHVKVLRGGLDGASVLLLAPWVYCVRGRMQALHRVRWTMHFCALTLVPCLLLFYFRELRFPQALLLFAILQIPVIFLRLEWIPPRLIPEDQEF